VTPPLEKFDGGGGAKAWYYGLDFFDWGISRNGGTRVKKYKF
jgi:hypothetical protein